LIRAYLDRWACEEDHRFTKQSFALESVQVRRFTTLANLVALASLGWALLAAHAQQGHVLVEHAKSGGGASAAMLRTIVPAILQAGANIAHHESRIVRTGITERDKR